MLESQSTKHFPGSVLKDLADVQIVECFCFEFFSYFVLWFYFYYKFCEKQKS